MIIEKDAIKRPDPNKPVRDRKLKTPTAPTPLVHEFETVDGDPLGVKVHTLRNGMKLYMSINDIEPRINTSIAVRAGSKHDPAETTGLAHYLEHMMFKGTDRMGALDWEKEKVLLQKISDLYEAHRNATDPEVRKAIYAQIDQVSNDAAKMVAANEYDQMVSSLGARGTNAYTWVEQTVYVNDIPTNELERWMKLESERFRMLVLRLFHTELEAVYEEFNISQDRDFRKVSAEVNKALFPSHPYGTQTTIGEGEHLKNPSHVKIHEYFSTYYKPNNMAIVLAGDFDPEQAVRLAEKYFGTSQRKPIPAFEYQPQPELDAVVRKEVFGQEAPFLQLAWRFDGAASEDADYLTMIYRLLYNRRAGLIDLNISQKQKALEARAWSQNMEDFSTFAMYGKPREGQNLKDVEQLLLAELENVKNGNFEEWLMDACIKDLKLSEIRANERNNVRTGQMTDAFILGLDWAHYVDRFERLEALTKTDIMRFAKEHFKDNYVVIYKRNGEDPNVVKVDKPTITPVVVNREQNSVYTDKFMAQKSTRLKPVFVDYEKEIQTKALKSGVELDFIKNKSNETFSLNYIVEMGRNSDKELALAISYLPYLGTNKYSPDQLKQEFFRLGIDFNVSVSNERVYVSLNGLDESLEEGVKLFEHILANVEGNEEALTNLVQDVLMNRENNKKNKRSILRSAMFNYARYGKESPFTNKLTEEELNDLEPANLVAKIKSLTSYDHRIFYYGSQEMGEVAGILDSHHKTAEKLKPVIENKQFAELPTAANQVFFVDFPMVQAEIMLVSKGSEQFNKEEFMVSELYNTYFGSGLSSIVFQEIRESRALAYSAYAYNGSPQKKEEAHYLQAYVGTQADKMPSAIAAMQEIIEDMPFSAEQIEQAVESIQKKIETGRVKGSNIYWNAHTTKERGFDHDLRKDIYDKMKTVTPADLKAFHQQYIKGRNYTYLVLGSKENIDMEYLKKIGSVTELTLDEVFGGVEKVRP